MIETYFWMNFEILSNTLKREMCSSYTCFFRGISSSDCHLKNAILINKFFDFQLWMMIMYIVIKLADLDYLVETHHTVWSILQSQVVPTGTSTGGLEIFGQLEA